MKYTKIKTIVKRLFNGKNQAERKTDIHVIAGIPDNKGDFFVRFA